MAFIGGHREKDESVQECAAREFSEELNIDEKYYHHLGILPYTKTLNDNYIIPSVGYIESSKLKDIHSNGEWDYAVSYPLNDLFSKDKWMKFTINSMNTNYPLYMFEMDFKLRSVENYGNGHKADTFILWGASAQITLNFIDWTKKWI